MSSRSLICSVATTTQDSLATLSVQGAYHMSFHLVSFLLLVQPPLFPLMDCNWDQVGFRQTELLLWCHFNCWSIIWNIWSWPNRCGVPPCCWSSNSYSPPLYSPLFKSLLHQVVQDCKVLLYWHICLHCTAAWMCLSLYVTLDQSVLND